MHEKREAFLQRSRHGFFMLLIYSWLYPPPSRARAALASMNDNVNSLSTIKFRVFLLNKQQPASVYRAFFDNFAQNLDEC